MKKKIIAAATALTMAALLCACSQKPVEVSTEAPVTEAQTTEEKKTEAVTENETTEPVAAEGTEGETEEAKPNGSIDFEPSGNLSEDWKDFNLDVDGKFVQLPCSYDEFSAATGYVWEEADDGEQTMKDGYATSEWLVSKDDNGRKVCIDLYNLSGEMKTFKECTVYGVYTYPNKTIGEDISYATITLGNGITDSSTAEEVLAAIGEEPYSDKTYDSGSRNIVFYVGDYSWDGSIEFDFNGEGVLDTFQIQTQ